MGFDGTAMRLLSLYRGERAAVRAHNFARVASCPLAAIHRAVPENGTIVEVGAGRGLVAGYLALRAPGRTVLGIEPDPDKVAIANRCHVTGQVRLAVGDADGSLPDRVDAVVVVDVLYLLSLARQDTLLARAAQALRPGGRLVVKEMATEAGLKMWLTRAQEHLAVRVLRWTRGGGDFVYRSPAGTAAIIEASGLCHTWRRVDGALGVHPHVLIVGHKPRTVER